MKKSLLTLSCTLSLLAIKAQSNLSFETWTGDDPASWTTSNQISAFGGPITVLQETALPGTGAIAAKLTVEACAVCGFLGLPDPMPGLMIQQASYTNRPEFLTFKWRGTIATGDTALIGGSVTLAAAEVGDAYFTIMPGTNQATWVTQVLTFNYANSNIPDTLTLGALTDQYLLFGGTGSTSTSTVVYVDDFILTGSVGLQTLETNNNLILAYPNPASSVINFNLLGTDASTLEVMDNSGKLVYTESNIQLKLNLNVEQFANGSYVARFTNNKKEFIGTARFNVIR